jgi:hypothetical protein
VDDGNAVVRGLLGLVILGDASAGKNEERGYIFHATEYGIGHAR